MTETIPLTSAHTLRPWQFLGRVFTLLLPAICLAFPRVDPPSSPLFREAATEVGLTFHHFTGATGEFYFPENMGPGAALIDYDNDGDLDVYLLQGKLLDERKHFSDALFPPVDQEPRNRLGDVLIQQEAHQAALSSGMIFSCT